MSQTTTPAADLSTTIPDAVLAPRVRKAAVRRAWRAARADLRAVLRHTAAYLGGLPAELESRRRLRRAATAAARKAARAAWCGRQGRRIDLAALLNVRRTNGRPVWTVGDPTRSAVAGYTAEGTWDTDGTVLISGTWVAVPGLRRLPAKLVPQGVPPIPPVAREILTDRTVRRRAKWVGLLYQPETWAEEKPDPAVVVEWKDRPGEYYCLCVWGPDRPRIMEWVD